MSVEYLSVPYKLSYLFLLRNFHISIRKKFVSWIKTRLLHIIDNQMIQSRRYIVQKFVSQTISWISYVIFQLSRCTATFFFSERRYYNIFIL